VTARRMAVGLVAALLWMITPGAAVAAPVPGATYNGVASDGGGVSFTLSQDGTLVVSYQLRGVPGNTCQFNADGGAEVWAGAPIEQNAFSYKEGNALSFQGSFPGAQTASGSFQLHQDANGRSPACDTGVVTWTASTTSAPRGGPGGAGPGGSGSGPGSHRRSYATRVSLREASSQLLAGRVVSAVGACRAQRTVILWRGSRRIASTRTKRGGRFTFARSIEMRGRAIRASAPSRKVPTGACAAASSKFIKG